MNVHLSWCLLCLAVADTSYVMDDSTIRTAVNAWLSDAAAAKATYGHISTWETGGVTDMSSLFCGLNWPSFGCRSAALSFNEDISAWDTSGVTSMERMFGGALAFDQDIGAWDTSGVTNTDRMFYRAPAFDQDLSGWRPINLLDMGEMFYDAPAFDQDLGWCLRNGVVDIDRAFKNTKCESTSCGIAMQDVFGICEPLARPCLIISGDDDEQKCEISSPTLFIIIIIVLVLLAGFCVHRRKKKDETYIAAACRLLCCWSKAEPSSVDSRPESPAKPPRDGPYEEATDLESAAETVEPSSLSKKFTSFFFGEQAPMEEEATALAVEKRTHSVGVPPGPLHVLFLDGTCRVHAVKRASPLWGVIKKGETLMSVNGKPVTPTTMFDGTADDGTGECMLVFQQKKPAAKPSSIINLRAVKSIHVRAGAFIDQVKFVYRSGSSRTWGLSGGSKKSSFHLGKSEYLHSIAYRNGTGGHLEAIQFCTNMGRYSILYRMYDSQKTTATLRAAAGQMITGLQRKPGPCTFIDGIEMEPVKAPVVTVDGKKRNTRPDSPAESTSEEATAPKETEATAVAPEAEESPQETLAEEPPPQENPVEEPPPPPAKKSWWFGRAEPEPEEAEQPPPLSPFSALRAERERELKTLASP